VEKELVTVLGQDENSRAFVLTEKGREFLVEYKRIERFSQAFGIEV
jgi:predicted transcriptional regulator